MKKNEGCKGYYYFIEEEQIRSYMKVPLRWKLQWIEDANSFFSKLLDKKTAALTQKFRRGEI